jgi:glycosyltransferase involved in cell wall biosynthesis
VKPYHFSIIIPTYGRPEQLSTCLKSLTRLSYPNDRFEVVVVDDGGGVPLKHVIDSFCGQLNVRLLTRTNAGPASARNTGAMEAKGKFLAFTDDDCSVDAGWLQGLAAQLSLTPDHMVGGRTINALPENAYSATNQLMTDAVYSYYNDDACKKPRFFTSNNFALAADHFCSLGGFDPSFSLAASEDREFCERWFRAGYQMTYVPEAVIYHAHLLRFRSFLKHHFKYGRGALHFHRVRLGRGWGRLKPDPEFYRHLFSYPFSTIGGWRALWLEVVLVLSYVAYTAGFLWERAKRATSGHTSLSEELHRPQNPKHLLHGHKRSREVQ